MLRRPSRGIPFVVVVVVVACLGALPGRARAQSCAELRAEIARLSDTITNEQRLLAGCTAHAGTCTAGQTDGIRLAIRTAQDELAVDRAALARCGPPPAPPPRVDPAASLDDVSPDIDFGDPGGGDRAPDPSGRVLTVVVDPRQPSTLYAASEFAGVWKSTDAAKTWTQASSGLTMSELDQTPPVLAIDDDDPRRLVLAASHDDFRPAASPARAKGVWVSVDGASHWRHATITGCADQVAYRVAFAAGHAYAATNCGLATSASADLATWTLLSSSFPHDSSTYVAATGGMLFACNGTTLRRGGWSGAAGGPSTFAWGPSATLPGSCLGLAIVPAPGAPAVAVLHTRAAGIDVSTVELRGAAPAKITSLALPAKSRLSGKPGVFVAARRGDARAPFDIFAADGYEFYAHERRTSDLAARWIKLRGVHVDTWSMAFPSTYDPVHGDCTAYAASDGGIRVSPASTAGHPCRADAGTWRRAISGLHIFAGSSIVGVRRATATCGSPAHDCPTLYLSGADNATWMSSTGGVPGKSWTAMPCCGDTGSGWIDWAAPGLLVLARNGVRARFKSADGTPPAATLKCTNLLAVVPGARNACAKQLSSAATTANAVERDEPPQQATFAQVISLTSEASVTPLPAAITNGDYFQVVNSTAGDRVFRIQDGKTWADIAPSQPAFCAPGPPPSTSCTVHVNAIAVAGGHTATTVYVLLDDGTMVQRRTDEPATAPWHPANGDATHALGTARDVWVNPDDPMQLYATDTGTGMIMVSQNGGQRWDPDTALTQIATHAGEFAFGCFGPTGQGRKFCSLQQVLFVRDRSELRVALTFPGGVALSRDGGATWRELPANVATKLRDLLAHPYAGYLDIGADSEAFSLYLALRGGPLVRVDSRF